MRGSLVTLKTGPRHFVHGLQLVLELLGVGDHGAEFVERERRAVQAGALLPEENRAGRGEFDQQRNGQNHRTRSATPAATSAPTKSMTCLTTLCQEASGVVRKTSSGRPSSSSKLVREICVAEKIGDEPDLDAFQFAGADDVFDLLEIGVLGAQDHAVDGMIVEHGAPVAARAFPGG